MGSNVSFVPPNRRMGDRINNSDTDTDPDPDIATILQYLIRSGQVRIITADSDCLYQEDSDDEFCSPPQADPNPDTSLLDVSDLRQTILLHSGTFNKNDDWKKRISPSLYCLLKKREVGVREHFTRGDCCQISQRLLPNKMIPVEQYPSKAFCGTYARDGELFMTACQDCNIRLYDTRSGHFKLIKTVQARDVGWSILDTAVSPDGRNFIYCSWSESIHICNIYGDHEMHEALPLCPEDRRFCIFSLRFSHDSREILGGANDECLYVYDREHNQRTLKIRSHEDDVNSVAFADSTSQILFSGGDDGLCKVWDRRTLNESHPKPVGILAGHLDGITYVDSKGDGRYLITNSKDQTIKLWDMRAFSPALGAEATKKAVASHNWDYRWQRVPKKLYSHRKRIGGDTSLMTYRGHSVLQTLVRCHFSPEFTTGQQFIYTGCAAGRIVIYDVLTGKIVSELSGHRACVRDVSWHPYNQEIISSSWDGSIGRWIYVGKVDSDTDDGGKYETDQVERNGLRRSRRLAEQKLKKVHP
ncbi:DDB1- and CUL4-associated factor 11-like [Centruroides sculpturatus]|uniref:DDB1- and CUL4-associated factor 11-like n=1 Tax=Centruroides sculpturatus TaxID=218467 RepID=UPI000C6D06F4|nr:DDB1- and CUL4-associated factor 11-like [Centruroides sculpturatus]